MSSSQGSIVLSSFHVNSSSVGSFLLQFASQWAQVGMMSGFVLSLEGFIIFILA